MNKVLIMITVKEREAINKIGEALRAEWEHYIVNDLVKDAAYCKIIPLYYFSAWRRSRLSFKNIDKYQAMLSMELNCDRQIPNELEFELFERLGTIMKELHKKYEDYIFKISRDS